MVKSIRTVLSTLLIISYVFGLRIIEFPAGHRKLWFSLFYSLLLWLVYCFLLIYTVIPYIPHYCKKYEFCVWLNLCCTLLSVFLQLYYDKKFRSCMERLAIVDKTLRELGTTTDCKKLSTKVIRTIAVWFLIFIFVNYGESVWWRQLYGIVRSIYFPIMLNHCCHINIVGDLIFMNILGYIGMKFDQINEHIRKLSYNESTDGKHNARLIWENPVSHSHRCNFSNALSSEYIIWTVMHLHLELRKISYEIDLMFGVQMTVKMACYFGFIAEFFYELFNTLFKDHISLDNSFYIAIDVIRLAIYVIRLFLINWTCEGVSAKANAMKDVMSKVSYSTDNMEIRENIMQVLLQIIRAPLKFDGVGLFQFGFKYFQRYLESILVLLVILLQVNKKDYIFFKWAN